MGLGHLYLWRRQNGPRPHRVKMPFSLFLPRESELFNYLLMTLSEIIPAITCTLVHFSDPELYNASHTISFPCMWAGSLPLRYVLQTTEKSSLGLAASEWPQWPTYYLRRCLPYSFGCGLSLVTAFQGKNFSKSDGMSFLRLGYKQ